MGYGNTDKGFDVMENIGSALSKEYVIPKDSKVLPPLASFCKCELAVNEDGYAMVIFNASLPEGIKWIEYDMDLSLLTFVTISGRIMELGMKVHPPFTKPLQMTKEIMMVQISADENDIEIMYPAKLVIRHIGI